jgi:hypothetical protein
MNTFKVPLTAPLKIIDTMIIEFEFRQPLGRDLIGAPDPQTDKTGWALTIAARCVTNAPASAVLDLPSGEAAIMAKEVASRIPTTLASSSTSTSSAPAPGGTSGSST